MEIVFKADRTKKGFSKLRKYAKSREGMRKCPTS